MSRHPGRLTATPSQTVGPFFHFGLADNETLGSIAKPDTKGERIGVRVRVLDGDGEPVPDALIELWQADADGNYVRRPENVRVLDAPGFTGFGRLPTATDGSCVFETIKPGRMRDAGGILQAPHINVCVFARGLMRQIYTRLYFAGDEGLDQDAVLTMVPEDRRQTLLAMPDAAAPGRWTFEIRLQGAAETVFFDL